MLSLHCHMATNTNSTHLYDRISPKYTVNRVFDIIILLLLTSVLVFRLLNLNGHGIAWLLAFLCESWFTFVWILTISTKWNPTVYETYPERLSHRSDELPPVDMFVTTADPVLEPPIITINTVLSLLAVDYPANKLACYVSDDGCSPLTYYSLVEASKFAKLWLPFCKKYDVQVRAPFRYFSVECSSPGDAPLEFQQDWRKLWDEYEELSRKIRWATGKSIPSGLSDDMACFFNIERGDHPAIIKVIWKNKENDLNELPHLIYISREKRPKYSHHYKAGAMNVITRVSGLMTNAPFMLNVDCDMFANNPQIIRHAMCLLLGVKMERQSGYVQCPQVFYDGMRDDPFGNQLVTMQHFIAGGIDGIQGAFYGGTGCFHRRKVIYGLCPEDVGKEATNCLTPVNARNLDDKELLKLFGDSREFIKSVAYALQGKINGPRNLSDLIEAAIPVASSGYENGTIWGSKIGWQYGSTTEDILTGMNIQARGWRSMFCKPNPPGFLGCVPSSGPTSMTQQKRWSMGLLEIVISKKSPIMTTINTKLQFRQSLAYLWVLLWGLRSIPECCYAILPAYCLIVNTNFLPKVQDSAFHIFIGLLSSYMIYYIVEYLQVGLSVRAWWNNQRMARIIAINAWLFGTLSVLLKNLGVSETVFEVTQKDESSEDTVGDLSRFTFDKSPIFVPGTTLLLLHLTSLVMGGLRLRPTVIQNGNQSGLAEMVCSGLIILCFWPFLKGLFRKGKYGIPLSTICKSALLTMLFVLLCWRCHIG